MPVLTEWAVMFLTLRQDMLQIKSLQEKSNVVRGERIAGRDEGQDVSLTLHGISF